MKSVVALLELKGQLVDDIDADWERIDALNVNSDGVVVTVTETTAETAFGGNGLFVPEQDDVGQRGYEQQQHEPPPYREKWGEAKTSTSYEGDGKQQEVETAF